MHTKMNQLLAKQGFSHYAIGRGKAVADTNSVATQEGAAAIVVSNHGGRQLDGAPSAISALPGVAVPPPVADTGGGQNASYLANGDWLRFDGVDSAFELYLNGRYVGFSKGSRMAAVDRNLMRAAVAELVGFPDTPRAVVINEALEIARKFSTPESVQFINGVLDSVGKQLESAR